MSDPTAVVVANCEYWMRIAVTLHKCVKTALLEVLHDPTLNGLPKNEHQLHAYLLAFKGREEQNLRRVIFPYQWDKLCHVCTQVCQTPCPRQGRTNSEDLDITMIVVLIINCTSLQPPNGNWRTFQPNHGDVDKAACVIFARELRNGMNHCTPNQITTKQEFDAYWRRIEDILNGLQYADMQLFKELENISLDQETSNNIKALIDFINTVKCDLSNRQDASAQEIVSLQADVESLEENLIVQLEKIKTTNNRIDTLGYDINNMYQKTVELQTRIECLETEKNERLAVEEKSRADEVEKSEERLSEGL